MTRITPRRLWRLIQHRRVVRKLTGRRLLAALAATYPEACFIEIGANDGAQHDHLRPFILSGQWTGVMVEPVPWIFDRLRQNYSAVDRVRLENAAVADHDGALPFFHLAEADPSELEELPHWYHGIGSFSREAVVGHAGKIANLEDRLVCTEVPCLTFASLCRKHDIEKVDLVVIDTEGYDHEIVRNLDLEQHKPRLLVYEHFHLEPGDRAQSRAFVEGAGYETMEEGFDTWCLDTGPADRLTEVWRNARPAVAGLSVHDEAA